MSAVYVVIAISNGADLEVCETYAGSNAALGRAFSLAKLRSFVNKEWLVPDPSEEKGPDGNPRWVFISTNKTYVAVHFQRILITPENYEPLKSPIHPDPSPNVTVQTNQAVLDPVVTFDAPYDDALPAGWFLDKKPATMKDLWETPELLKSAFELSSTQMWALVKARISKRPNFHLDVPGFGIFDQARALREIDQKTVAGEEVVESEIEWLEDVRNDRSYVLSDE